MKGQNIYFNDNVIKEFQKLNSVYKFKDFCKMSVREEIERRRLKKERNIEQQEKKN